MSRKPAKTRFWLQVGKPSSSAFLEQARRPASRKNLEGHTKHREASDPAVIFELADLHESGFSSCSIMFSSARETRCGGFRCRGLGLIAILAPPARTSTTSGDNKARLALVLSVTRLVVRDVARVEDLHVLDTGCRRDGWTDELSLCRCEVAGGCLQLARNSGTFLTAQNASQNTSKGMHCICEGLSIVLLSVRSSALAAGLSNCRILDLRQNLAVLLLKTADDSLAAGEGPQSFDASSSTSHPATGLCTRMRTHSEYALYLAMACILPPAGARVRKGHCRVVT